MDALKLTIVVMWGLFWIGWLTSAFTAKRTIRSAGARGVPLRGLTAAATVVLLRVSYVHGFNHSALAIHNTVLGAIGVALVAAGLLIAVWARVYLGRNWGMPMSQREAPELVSSGPYRYVRHPIYTGLILGVAGTVLVTSVVGAAVLIAVIPYFVYAGRIEERNLEATFPEQYPAYRARTKMLIPFLL